MIVREPASITVTVPEKLVTYARLPSGVNASARVVESVVMLAPETVFDATSMTDTWSPVTQTSLPSGDTARPHASPGRAGPT